MVTIGTHLYQYANGDKVGVKHSVRKLRGRMIVKENKNITRVQNFLSNHWESLMEAVEG